MTPQLTLTLGGASSGKSAWAEALVSSMNRPRIYIATAQAWDSEMEAKIAAHREMRGADWQTFEAPHALSETLRAVPPGHSVLLDCVTMWLSNRLLDSGDPEAEIATVIEAMAGCASPVVAVSNEVGQGIVPDTPLGRRFRDAQGRINRRIAARAELVVAVMAGLPLALKGQLPEDIEW